MKSIFLDQKKKRKEKNHFTMYIFADLSPSSHPPPRPVQDPNEK